MKPDETAACGTQTEITGPGRRAALVRLFFSILTISAFTFGGGFVIVTFMKKKFVDTLGWISEDEMLEITALASSAPGAIAVNASILVGWRVGGFAGMLVSTVACVIPPLVILGVISLFYNAFADNRYVEALLMGMQAGVAAVIVDVVIRLGQNVAKERSLLSWALMAGVFVAAYFLRINVVFLLLGAAAIGAVRLLAGRERRL